MNKRALAPNPFALAMVALVCTCLTAAAQTATIAAARALPAGTLVQVRGVVINGPELGPIRYLQDASAGIAAYPGNGSTPGFESAVGPGDSIEISGYLTSYNGLLEISPILTYKVHAHGKPLPAPKTIGLADLDESLEGQLVRINCVRFQGPGAVFNNGGVYSIQDPAGNTADIYLRSGHPLIGVAQPDHPVQLTAILSQYGDYQLLLRTPLDFGTASCFYFQKQPSVSAISTTGLTVEWETNVPSMGTLFVGKSPGNWMEWPAAADTATAHTVQLSGLEPGTIYWARVRAGVGGDTLFSPAIPVATQSLSSGQIKVYFNHPIDSTAANGLQPDGDSFEEVLNETIARIGAAQHTIDVAMYNTNRYDIVNALKQASAKGVRIRYIAADATENQALKPSPGFPVLFGNSQALMHNKFMIIDAESEQESWVMSGSVNWTTVNMVADFNNALFIQDQSLAKAYEIEFNEMWGGSGPQPEPLNSRFGEAKSDNTPHQFVIGAVPVECWFSPSDQVTRHITETIESADEHIGFAIFSFTKDEIGNALVQAKKKGAEVRGLLENIDDPGCEFNWLTTNGLVVLPHPEDGAIHHKYLVADAGLAAFDPLVLTGSHNWTQAAESINDENTLVLHHPGLALLYQAELEQRWRETTTPVNSLDDQEPEVYPNPATDMLYIRGLKEKGVMTVWSSVGQKILEINLPDQEMIAVPVGHLPAGFYLASIQTARGTTTISFQTLSR